MGGELWLGLSGALIGGLVVLLSRGLYIRASAFFALLFAKRFFEDRYLRLYPPNDLPIVSSVLGQLASRSVHLGTWPS